MTIDFQASPSIRATIATMGRTEDIRFSPDNRRLAAAEAQAGVETIRQSLSWRLTAPLRLLATRLGSLLSRR